MAFLIHNLPFHSGILLQLQGGSRTNSDFMRGKMLLKLVCTSRYRDLYITHRLQINMNPINKLTWDLIN